MERYKLWAPLVFPSIITLTLRISSKDKHVPNFTTTSVFLEIKASIEGNRDVSRKKLDNPKDLKKYKPYNESNEA